LSLVKELGITDIVFPTAWFSELPFLTGKFWVVISVFRTSVCHWQIQPNSLCPTKYNWQLDSVYPINILLVSIVNQNQNIYILMSFKITTTPKSLIISQFLWLSIL
jgi:hypothetical protein